MMSNVFRVIKSTNFQMENEWNRIHVVCWLLARQQQMVSKWRWLRIYVDLIKTIPNGAGGGSIDAAICPMNIIMNT